MQWGKEFYSKAENEDAGQIVQSPDGNLVIVGNTGQYPNPYFATYIEKMNITTGNEIWGQLIDSVGGYITVSGDGNLIFRGFYDGLAPPGVKGLFFVNNQDGTILSAESFDTPYPGYALSYEYVGAFSDSEELYTGLINNQWPGLLKIKNHKTFEWAQKLPGVTSYGGAHINQNSAAVSYIAQNNIYTAANLITTVLSDTNTKEEYNTYLARTDLNGKSACSDTFAIKLQFTQLPIPQTVACAWYKTYDLSGVDTPSIFAAHLAVSCGIDCYQTTCCRDTMVDKTITFCKGDSYTLPDGSVAAQAGVYTVDLKQASGCDSVVNVTINPIPPTQPQLGDDTCFVDGNPVVLEASAHYAQSYLWQDGSTDSFYNASIPGTYWVQAKNICGTATDSVIIYPSCSFPIYVPSAFTPNGDGRNDIFRIASMKGLKLLDFSVYNRWGQCVFKTANPQQGWDGTIKGQLSPPGVFVYSIQYVTINGINKSLKGTVVLIR